MKSAQNEVKKKMVVCSLGNERFAEGTQGLINIKHVIAVGDMTSAKPQ